MSEDEKHYDNNINYTECFFKLIEKADNIRTNEDQKIKTLGLGPNYYCSDEDQFIIYKGIEVENLDYSDIYLGGYRNNYMYCRQCNQELINNNDILILSRVGEHLIDFQTQINYIWKSGIAKHVLLLLPNMEIITNDLIKMSYNIHTIDFKLERTQIEILSTTDDAIEDLHSIYTSPRTFEHALSPYNKNCSSIKIEYKKYECVVNGYPHFLVHLEFKNVNELRGEFKKEIGIPIGKRYITSFDKHGVYYQKNDIMIKIANIEDNIEKIISENIPDADLIVFNKVLSCQTDLKYLLYSICAYIHPGTKILILEDDMVEIAEDIINVESVEEFWNLNSILFGPNYQYRHENNISSINTKYNKKVFIDNTLLDVYMTQENLYKKINIEYCHENDYFYDNKNTYTFGKLYERI